MTSASQHTPVIVRMICDAAIDSCSAAANATSA